MTHKSYARLQRWTLDLRILKKLCKITKNLINNRFQPINLFNFNGYLWPTKVMPDYKDGRGI